MNLEKITIFRALLVTQLNHWILFPFAVTVLDLIYKQEPTMWLWLLCSLVPFAAFVVRRYTNIFVFFVLGHGLIVSAFFFLSVTFAEKLAILVYVTGYIISSFYLRLQTTHRMDSPFHPGYAIGIVVVLLAIQNWLGKENRDIYYILSVIVFLGLYFLQYYLKQYLEFLTVNESSTGYIPREEIFRCAVIPVSFFCIITVLILLGISNLEWLKPFFTILKELLLGFAKWFFSMLSAEPGTEDAVLAQSLELHLPGTVYFTATLKNARPSGFWTILTKIAVLTIICLTAYTCIFLVRSSIRFLRNRFREKLLNVFDLAVFAGHKTLYGPTGIAGFIMDPAIDLPPVIFGGTGFESANQNMPKNLPERYEMGTMNISGIAGLNAALKWGLSQGIGSIWEKEQEHRKRLIELLQEYWFIRIVGDYPDCNYVGIVSCLIEGISSDSAGEIFDRCGIAVRTGLQCAPLAHQFVGTHPAGTVRFSVGYFTSEDDFEELRQALDYIEENL